MVPSPNGNTDVSEQMLVNSHASQAPPPGAPSDIPAAPDTAQHAQQAVPVKRKRGRPRKVPLKPVTPPIAGPATLLPSSTGAGTAGVVQQTIAPPSLPDAAPQTLNPAAPTSQGINLAVPAGALMPHKHNASSQSDTGKPVNARSKAQQPSGKASASSSMVAAHRTSNGATFPESVTAVPIVPQPAFSGPHTAPEPAAAPESRAPAAAAAVMATAAAWKTAPEDGTATANVTEAASKTVLGNGHTAAAAAVENEAAQLNGLAGERDAATEAGTVEVMPVEVPGSPVKQTLGSARVATARRQSEASAATLSAPQPPTASSGKTKHGDASKLSVATIKAQSTADQTVASTSGGQSLSAAVPATAVPLMAPPKHAVPVHSHTSEGQGQGQGQGHPPLKGAPVHTDPVHAHAVEGQGQGHAASKGSSISPEGRAVGQTQQGQEAAQTDSARDGGAGSRLHAAELPSSLLLAAGPVKKRGRPYKNAASAAKAAQREARRAAHEAAEKAAYQAASQAAQVVISAPPVKKRRGRPPKDPAKLAAALAAYHANTQARQASMDAEQSYAGLDTVMEAAQAAAAQASAAAGQPPAVSVPQADVGASTTGSAPPPPAQKKRSRLPRSIAKALGDALQTLSGSLGAANGGDGENNFWDGFRGGDFDGNDDDQALLDAAAVLTSDLPFPQGVRRQAEPPHQPNSRQLKGKRRSGNHAKAAVQSDPTPAYGRRGRRGLELVSSRATALLDSIGPDPQGLGESPPPPRPHPYLLPAKRAGPPVGSKPESAAPLPSGPPVKRRRKAGHSSLQPATAASGSTVGQPQTAPTQAPLPSSPGPHTVSDAGNDAVHALADGSTAVPVPTATASTPDHLAAAAMPVPDAATDGTSSAASPLPNGPPPSSAPEVTAQDKLQQRQVHQQPQHQQHLRVQMSHQVAEEDAAQQEAAVDDHTADDADALIAVLQQQAAEEGSQGRATIPKGDSPLLTGKAALLMGMDPLPEGKDRPFSQTSSGGIQPPVMLSHLAHSKAAGFRESLKKKLNVGHELDSLPTRQSSSAHKQSAQPDLHDPSAALTTAEQKSGDTAEAFQQQPPLDQDQHLHAASPSSQPHQREGHLPEEGEEDEEEPLPSAEPASPLSGPADHQPQLPTYSQRMKRLEELLEEDDRQLQQPQAEEQHLHRPQQAQQAQHGQQAVLQQPVLALLSSGLPPILLGTFQGDMQRARIILEAAGFLVPLDISSSLLPPGLAPSLPQQAQRAASGHVDEAVPGCEASGMMQSPEGDLQLANVQQASSQGASLRGSHRRKQKRGGEQATRDLKSPKSPQQQGVERPKRGRSTNAARQAMAAAATDTTLYSNGGAQEEWQRMGFRGEFQGTGQLQDALHQHDHTLDGSNSGRDAPHSRHIPKVHVKPGRSVKRTRTDREPANQPRSLPDSASMDIQQPHVPRRKRSRQSDLVRPLEVLAEAKAAARVSHGGHVHQDDHTSDPLRSLAAAPAAESESDAEVTRGREQGGGRATHMSQSGYTSPPEGVQRTQDEDAQHQHTSHEGGGGSMHSHQAVSTAWLPSLVEPPTGQAGGGEALVGRLVAKRFGSYPALFKGKVGYYAPRLCPQAPFHIQYEDGDSEDLSLEEVVAILV
ncbi:hypothetical protein ABBQ32_012843 [Trebouxia sp. C0010 RCD-2024]